MLEFFGIVFGAMFALYLEQVWRFFLVASNPSRTRQDHEEIDKAKEQHADDDVMSFLYERELALAAVKVGTEPSSSRPVKDSHPVVMFLRAFRHWRPGY